VTGHCPRLDWTLGSSPINYSHAAQKAENAVERLDAGIGESGHLLARADAGAVTRSDT
jgi:hypothetical protein